MFNKDVKFSGVPFEYGDDVVIVPVLPLGQMKTFQKQLAELNVTKEADEETQQKGSEIMYSTIIAALKRNYPEITKEQVEDFVNFENLHDVHSAAVYGTSDVSNKVKTVVEAQDALEKKRHPQSLTGVTSTAE